MDASEVNPLSTAMDITESSMKFTHGNNLPSHHSHGHNRSRFSKRSRHLYGHQYFRRKSANQANASTPQAKTASTPEEKLSFSLANESNLETERQADEIEKEVCKLGKIKATPMITNNGNTATTICGICQKTLKRKPYSLGNVPSSTEISVVAVLVCGHVYHAECLELRTSFEHRREPLCPTCSGAKPEED